MRNRLFLAVILIAMLAVMIAGTSAHEDDPPDGSPATGWQNITLDYTPTYYAHVQPIIEANCLGCHAPGQIGYASAALDDVQLVAAGAEDIAFYAQTGYMPPWMPGPETLPLQNPRTLTAEEIAILTAWAQADAPLGDPMDAAPVAAPFVLPDIRPDMVLQQTAPYTPDTTNTDDYRCFLYDAELADERFLTGFIFEPDQTEILHHAIVYRIDGAARGHAEFLDGLDGHPGWSCYNTTGLGGQYEEMIGAWAPGTMPQVYPSGMGFRISPDDLLVVQIHYNTAAGLMSDQSRVVLQFADEDERIVPLMTAQLLAPVEIPCPDGVDGERCTREYAVRYAAERYGAEFRGRPDFLLRDCGKNLLDYANNTADHAESSCDITVPGFVVALGVFGHMHELGKSLRIEVNPDTDNARVLLDIPEWDFHWQDGYQFVTPVMLRRGDVVRLTCVWDNTLSEDPRYIVWGEGTGDEMCFATVTIVGG